MACKVYIESSDELDGVRKLINASKKVLENAFAPFSHFRVGAAILTEKGNMYTGCNVENSSFGGTICAERGAAMASVAAEGYSRFKAIAIATEPEDPAQPCGICRQFLSQFTSPDVPVYLVSVTSGVVKRFDFGDLMPFAFVEF